MFWLFDEVKHLNGEYASAKEKQGAFANTAASFIPFSKGGFVSKEVIENLVEHGTVNAEENITLKEGTKELPTQMHHFATNKHSLFTPQMNEIADQFGLKLDEAWNKAKLPHLGRHPNAYHNFVLSGMKKAAAEAGGSRAKLLELFEQYVIKPVQQNPELLRKSGW